MSSHLTNKHTEHVDAAAELAAMIADAEKTMQTSNALGPDKAHRAIEFAQKIGVSTGIQRCYTILADEQAIAQNNSQAERLLDKALEGAIADGDWYTEAEIYRIRYILARNRLDWDGAIACLRRSIAIHENHNSFDLLGQRSLARIYYDLAMLPEAMETLHRVDLEAQKSNKHHIRASIWRIIAIVYRYLGDLTQSESANQYCIQLAKQYGNTEVELFCLASVGTMNMERGNFAEALPVLENIHQKFLDLNQNIDAVIRLENIAHCYMEMGNVEQAMAVVQRMIRESRQYGLRGVELSGLIFKSELLIRLKPNDLSEAHTGIYAILDQVEEQGLPHTRSFAYEVLVGLHTKLNEPQQAALYEQKLADLDEELYGKKIQQRIAGLKLRYDLEQSRIEKELLYKQNVTLENRVEQLDKELVKMALTITQKHASLLELQREIAELERSGSGKTLRALRQLSHTLQKQLDAEPAWDLLEKLFTSVHGNYILNLTKAFPQLSPGELKVCILLKLDMTSKQIADTLCLSDHTINTHRQRIRKKVQLPRNLNLTSFLQQFSAKEDGVAGVLNGRP